MRAFHLGPSPGPAPPAPQDASLVPVVTIPQGGIPLDEIERLAILEALKMTKGIQVDAAKLLRISPRVLHYKIKIHGLRHAANCHAPR